MLRAFSRTILVIIYIGFMLGMTLVTALTFLVYDLSKEGVSLEEVQNYVPPITTRVHAGDGSMIHEFAREHRVYVTIDRIPLQLQHAFLAAEDQRFYEHWGVDIYAIARAAIANIRLIYDNRRPIGASTITQQVARNFLLTNRITVSRKIREAIIAFRIEKILSKDKILELYLNRIYLGSGQYGVASAALNYFNKALDELTLAEMAYLAALPKAPSNYHPTRNYKEALARRDWVLLRMYQDSFVGKEAYEEAVGTDLVVTSKILRQRKRPNYFVEEVRRQIGDQFQAQAIYENGYSIRTTLEPELQDAAERALRAGLVLYDRRHGWRGASDSITLLEDNQQAWIDDLVEKNKSTLSRAYSPWQLAVVLSIEDDSVDMGLPDNTHCSIILEESVWARPVNSPVDLKPKSMSQILSLGDIVYVERTNESQSETCTLQQAPEVDGGLVAMDPHTGRVLAMVGGWSFYLSEFNRVTQAKRQPGSAFKPFVYLAALEQGFPPNTRILDAPLLLNAQAQGLRWRPENYSRVFYGPTSMRTGIERSRNLMTIRLALSLGMSPILDVANRFGLADNITPNYASALGTGETTLLQLTTAYAMLVNGGINIEPSLIDYIQDRTGRIIYRTDKRACTQCNVAWNSDGSQLPPPLLKTDYFVTTPQSAYQIVSMLEGVISRGTGWRLRDVPYPLAGKTGTSDNSIDTWFLGFSPDLAVGVFVGHNIPRTLADEVYENETGSSVAVPIWKMFIQEALAGKSPTPFRVPDGVTFINIDSQTGKLAQRIDKQSLLEVFKLDDPLPGGEESILLTGKSQSGATITDQAPQFQPAPPQNGDGETGIY